MTDLCLKYWKHKQKVSVWREAHWRHRFLSNWTQLSTNTACCCTVTDVFWWFDCFPKSHTPGKMLQSRWEGRMFSPLLKVLGGHDVGKKGVSYIANESRTVFFIPVATACDEFFVWLPLKCIRECCRQIVCNGKLAYLLSGDCVSQKQTTVSCAGRVCNNLIVTSDTLGLFCKYTTCYSGAGGDTLAD